MVKDKKLKFPRQEVIFIVGFILLLILTATVAFVDSTGRATLGILILTTTFTGIGSIATYIQAVEIQHQRQDAERPDIVVYFKPHSRLMYCIVENLGNLTAHNISIEFNPSPMLGNGKNLQDISLFARKIPFLPPNERYWKHLGASPDVLSRNNKPFEVTIKYEAKSGKSFVDKITIDLTILNEANDPAPTNQEELARINKHLEKIVEYMGRDRNQLNEGGA